LRCERLDRQALAWCEEAAWFRARRGHATEDDRTRVFVERNALVRRYLVIYRTLADPRYLDPTIDPSPRPLGSVFSFGRDPIAGNYGEGLARAMSARGWLSTWSGLSSNAALERTLPAVRVPALVVAALADTDIYPSECRRQLAALGSDDKEYYEQDGADHYFRPAADGADPRRRLADAAVLPWLRARFAP
jgi:hypothetical protein